MVFKTNRKNFIVLIITFGFIEGIALSLIGLFKLVNLDRPDLPEAFFGGVIIGSSTSFVIIILLNILLRKFIFTLNSSRINKISLLSPIIYSAVLLALIFVFESFLISLKHNYGVIGKALFGFFAVFLSLFLITHIYNFLNIKIYFWTFSKKYTLSNISCLSLSLLMGIYEAIFIPLYYSLNFQELFYIFFWAFVCGGFSMFLTCLLYRFSFQYLPLKLLLKLNYNT